MTSYSVMSASSPNRDMGLHTAQQGRKVRGCVVFQGQEPRSRIFRSALSRGITRVAEARNLREMPSVVESPARPAPLLTRT